tara:strand:+ start:64531 stop:65433 length:903 start_codon:yes stop_codon:yes gene_type:complete
MIDQIKPEWLAVDWGTSTLRVWAMQGATVLDQVQSDDALTGRHPEGFAPTLQAVTAHWHLPRPVMAIACGMVGARQGWVEAPYQTLPCTPIAPGFAHLRSDVFDLHVISGLCQQRPNDVMRGEETQIAGFLALNPNWDGVICLPGTHTKWAQVSAGEVISFQTYMTGEMFGLLAGQSVLRHSVQTEGWEDAAFDMAVSEALSRPEKLAARLFAIHADDRMDGTAPEAAKARLSGLLIGAELAAARPYWLGQNLAIIGADPQAALYARALDKQGAPATLADAPRMTLAGLCAAFRLLKGNA